MSPTALTLHPPSTDSHVETTYHDRLVAHVELGLSRDQGLLVLLNDWGDPAKDVQVLGAGKARGESASDH